MRSPSSLAPFLFLLAACGGAASAPIDEHAPSGTPATSATPAENGTADGREGEAGPTVTLSLRGSTAPVAHGDGLSGQTPLAQAVAVRSFWLLRDEGDPSPVKIAEVGDAAVEVDLVSGVTKDVATVPVRSLPAGTFRFARVGVAFVRYTIAARLHAGGFATDGQYTNVEALTDGALVDGAARKKGWFRSSFATGGPPLATTEGENAPLPALPSSGGMRLDTSGTESAYVFPIDVVVDPSHPTDLRLLCEVDVHESFRWQDQPQAGYAPKVFDTTPTGYEPVMSFGASAFALRFEPR